MGWMRPSGQARSMTSRLRRPRASVIALGLSLARGGDPDSPRGLLKVTKTR